MLHDGTPTTYQLGEPLIVNCESNNSVTTTIQNAVRLLRMIGSRRTIGFYLRNFMMHWSHSTRQLYVAKAITILSQSGFTLSTTFSIPLMRAKLSLKRSLA